MKYALVNDLEQSALVRKKTGIGSIQQCVKLFDTEEEAEQFATELILKHCKPRPKPEDLDGVSVLEWFQESCGGLEWFHIFPVVE